MPYLEKLGFHIIGYGCTTCIGNSGPLPEPVASAVVKADLVAASVLSGNRNFEGRINPHAKANYLASPPLVVAYALSGTVDKNLVSEPLGKDKSGKDVYLKEIWPEQKEISSESHKSIVKIEFRYPVLEEKFKNFARNLPSIAFTYLHYYARYTPGYRK